MNSSIAVPLIAIALLPSAATIASCAFGADTHAGTEGGGGVVVHDNSKGGSSVHPKDGGAKASDSDGAASKGGAPGVAGAIANGGAAGAKPAGGAGGAPSVGGSSGVGGTPSTGGAPASGGAGGGGPSGAGGSPTQDCGLQGKDAKCDGCLVQSCCAEAQSCASSSLCLSLLDCLSGCSDQDCVDFCANAYSGGVSAYNSVASCLDLHCTAACDSGASGSGGTGGSGSAGSGGGGPAGSGGSTSSDPAQKCVDVINQYRATLNLPPYGRWYGGEVCASQEAQHDSAVDTAHDAFGSCSENAQNECPRWYGPPEAMIGNCLAMMWAEGPGADFQAHGHYINMSSTNYAEVACGFYSGSNGVWSVQNFR